MIQVVPTRLLSEPMVPNVDWSALHQAVAVVEAVVREAIGREVSLGIRARHVLGDDPNEDDCDFTEILLTLEGNNSCEAFSPSPRMSIIHDVRTSMNCDDFLERIEDGFYSIGRQWCDMATSVKRARRMVALVESGNQVEEAGSEEEAAAGWELSGRSPRNGRAVR